MPDRFPKVDNPKAIRDQLFRYIRCATCNEWACAQTEAALMQYARAEPTDSPHDAMLLDAHVRASKLPWRNSKSTNSMRFSCKTHMANGLAETEYRGKDAAALIWDARVTYEHCRDANRDAADFGVEQIGRAHV